MSFRARGWLVAAFVYLACVSLGQAGDAIPPLTNLRVSPNPAMAGQPVTAVLQWNGCGGWSDVDVQVSGSTITFTHEVHDMCGVSLPGGDMGFALGTFPVGRYTVVYAPTAYPAQSAILNVVSPVVVPSGSVITAGILSLLVAGMGLLIGCRQQRSG